MVIILIILAITAAGFIYFYNRLVRVRQLVNEAESGVDVQLKRRHDLIPNLVAVVKGYAAHEKNVLEEVVQLRGRAAGLKQLEQRSGAENQLTQGIKSIFALAEAYPDLKADSQFINLHNSLVEVENDIQMSRRYYNGTVRDLNVLVQAFPGNLVAGMFAFQSKEFFEIETATEKATPQVRL